MNWEMITRASGLREYVCIHGVGHPDPESANEVAARIGAFSVDYWLLHGCDGCCGRDDFPGANNENA